ncbi:MAG: ATP-grasp domain-containing protein [Melioribacteraceae bacterium]|nr:ATP-grasp domain-containing protein [Melioribacteraceae bacterium]
MNILITSAGRRVSLVRSFQKELKEKFEDGKVFTTDMVPELSSACNISDKYFAVPRVTSADYIDILLNICLKNSVKMVVPTIDTELMILAENKELFKSKGIEVIISDKRLIKICRDKRLTHNLFDELNIKRAKDIDKNNPNFPLFIKPFDGSCSKDIYVIENKSMLIDYHTENEKLMFLEYLDPKDHTEFTLDLYYDKNSKLKSVVPRKRIEIRSGEINKGITKKNDLIGFVKEKLSVLDGAVGCITLQLFVNNRTNEKYGIEINPRFGGGYPLSYLAGANYTKWLIEEYFEEKEIYYFDAWEDNLLMLRYDHEVIVRNAKV